MTTDANDVIFGSLAEAVEMLGTTVQTFAGVKPPRGFDGHRLVSELTLEWERANHRRLIRPAQEEENEDRPEVPLLSPSEVLARWRREGSAWLLTSSRLELRAVVVAAKDATIGPAILTDGAFWPSLKARARDRQSDQVLNTGYFIAGHLPWIEVAIRSRAGRAPAEVPAWWVAPGPTGVALAAAVARLAGGASYGEVLDQLDLPDALPEAFMAEVARASQATEVAELANLRSFLDRGVEMGNKAVIFDSTREWVRRVIQVGTRFPGERLALAELLRRRIGELVAGRDDARWSGLEEERRTVRAWLIGAIFKVLFSHLVPDGQHRHMTEPRRLFWSKYDHSVEKIWLLICDDHRNRLNGDEAVAKLKQHGLLEVLRFTGQPEQDGVWMQLRSSRGEQVTILEGNANMPIRIRSGAFIPPIAARATSHSSNRVVEYNHARSLFSESVGATMIAHQGDWQSRARNALGALTVYPAGAR